LEFIVKASAAGTLFSGIGKKEIVNRLKGKTKAAIAEKNILLENDLKKLGEYTAQLKLDQQVVDIKIIIKQDGQ